jgi:hypothetical protein
MAMTNNRVVFETYFHKKIKNLVCYKEITGHLIFDVKLSENFRRKVTTSNNIDGAKCT